MVDSSQNVVDIIGSMYGTNRTRTSCFCNSQETKIKSWKGIRLGLDKIEGIP